VTSPSRTIAIVGGGFSGTVLASHLLRFSYWKPLHVVLVERGRIGRGVAYAESEYPYLLNVPAARMSTSSRDPQEFLRFARQKLPDARAEDFLPRSLYGEYLESLLAEAEARSPPHVRLERVQGEVQAIRRQEDAAQRCLTLALADGRIIAADTVVLATGNPPPAQLPGIEALAGTGRYFADPWAAPQTFRPGETILAVGTGLTMADVVLAGAAATGGQVQLHALSRHGLIPPSQTAFRFSAAQCEGDGGTLLRAASTSARSLLRAVRELARGLEAQGSDWREAVTFVRNLAPALWQRLSSRERQRFLRHARTYWDIHRHRLPQATLSGLMQLRLAGQLHVHAGRIVRLEPAGNRVQVTWRPRGSDENHILVVDRIVNCTGPDYNPRRTCSALLEQLLSDGLVSPDTLGLGLRTGSHGAVQDGQGRLASDLYYLGPLLRADHWESTAVPELRGHAERLAHFLAVPAAAGRTLPVRLPEPQRFRSIA
jgi:uncharacterized NAD(P)/FAD-binding protein YdhS